MVVSRIAASAEGKLSACTISVVAGGGSAATTSFLGCSMEVTIQNVTQHGICIWTWLGHSQPWCNLHCMD